VYVICFDPTKSCAYESCLSSIVIVSGTLRSNLDPFNSHDDATLWDALKRSYLVDSSKPDSLTTSGEAETASGAQTPVNRFTLETVIEDEGGNLSIGQVCAPLEFSLFLELTLRADLSSSGLLSRWPGHWLRTRKSSSWMKQLVTCLFFKSFQRQPLPRRLFQHLLTMKRTKEFKIPSHTNSKIVPSCALLVSLLSLQRLRHLVDLDPSQTGSVPSSGTTVYASWMPARLL
jgi:hypothetical protein